MAGKKVVTVGDNHVCPMVSGITPHIGGPVVGPGCPGMMLNGKPVAVVGDTCICNGPPDVIVQGCPGVLINGKPIAIEGAMTAHGGIVMSSNPGVMVCKSNGEDPDIITISRIPFSKIRTPQRILSALTGSRGRIKKIYKELDQLKDSVKKNSPLPDYDFSD